MGAQQIQKNFRFFLQTKYPQMIRTSVLPNIQKDMQERPVYLDETRPHPRLRKRLYELSRMAD